jgi:hypothetical protein
LVVLHHDDRHLAFRGGGCRSDKNNIPHRHYDTGSLIYRLGGVNVLADSGLEKYTDTFWNDFDSPEHVRSAAPLHNVVLADGRGHRYQDYASGQIVALDGEHRGLTILIWRLDRGFPGLAAWERQVLFADAGWLLVVDRLKPAGARTLSVLWHLHEMAVFTGGNRWKSGAMSGQVLASGAVSVTAGDDHPRPYIKIDLASGTEEVLVVSAFSTAPPALRLEGSIASIADGRWDIAGRRWETVVPAASRAPAVY